MIDVQRLEWALCLGGASCVWDDVKALEAMIGMPWPGQIIAANDIGAHWPRPVHHWVSLHPEKFQRWKALRVELGNPMDPVPVTWGRQFKMKNQAPKLADHELVPWNGGSSGMLAVQVAKLIGCTRAVLCGIPITQTAHFTESHERFGKDWASANGYWKAWGRYRGEMDHWVKSMSGRTQELLGAPTAEWLKTGTIQWFTT